MAIRNFKNKVTEDINYGRATKESFRILPKELHRKAQIKLARLGAVTSMQDLKEIRGNCFEKLKEWEFPIILTPNLFSWIDTIDHERCLNDQLRKSRPIEMLLQTGIYEDSTQLISCAVFGPIKHSPRLSGISDSVEDTGMVPPMISAYSCGYKGSLSGLA